MIEKIEMRVSFGRSPAATPKELVAFTKGFLSSKGFRVVNVESGAYVGKEDVWVAATVVPS